MSKIIFTWAMIVIILLILSIIILSYLFNDIDVLLFLLFPFFGGIGLAVALDYCEWQITK